MACLQIITLNCQGLKDREKRKDVLNYLKSKAYSIYCLQDTHFTLDLEPYIETQWGFKCIFNSYTGNARGVAIMLNNNFEYKIHIIKKDNLGNYFMLDITIEDERMTLVNIYGPNTDNEIFYQTIFDKMKNICFVDDTSFILDGSPESLYNTLSVLDYYAHISGLKINYSKSKAIWIGKKKLSKNVFHHMRWKLEWGATQFNLLGINFSVNMEHIVEHNYDSKIIDMRKLMRLWSCRKLTVLGRITVLKTLTHLLIALPNPNQKIIKKINTLFF